MEAVAPGFQVKIGVPPLVILADANTMTSEELALSPVIPCLPVKCHCSPSSFPAPSGAGFIIRFIGLAMWYHSLKEGRPQRCRFSAERCYLPQCPSGP